MDTLCILDASRDEGDCLMVMGNGFKIGDIWPCPPPVGTGPDGAIEIMDTLGVLDAPNGAPPCEPMCPCD